MSLTQEEINKIKIEFDKIDKNHSGLLDLDELTFFCHQNPQLRCFPRLILAYYGKDGHVSFDQFIHFYKGLNADPESNEYIAKVIFDIIDMDKSGKIDSDEISTIIRYIDIPEGTNGNFMVDVSNNMTYPRFKDYFFKFLKIIWKSVGYSSF